MELPLFVLEAQINVQLQHCHNHIRLHYSTGKIKLNYMLNFIK